MARYEGTSPFQQKNLTWSEDSQWGFVRNAKGSTGVVDKPVLDFEFDGLVADPLNCHKVTNGEDSPLTEQEINAVETWLDGFAIFGISDTGQFLGPRPVGEYHAEAASGPPHAHAGEQWIYADGEWIDGRDQAEILEYAQTRKIDELWAFTLAQIEADAAQVEVSAGTYWFGMDSNTFTNFERTLRGIDLGTVLNPRPWTPKGEIMPISVTHDDIKAIASVLGLRYDDWMTAYLTHKATVRMATDPVAVEAYDYSMGWPNQS